MSGTQQWISAFNYTFSTRESGLLNHFIAKAALILFSLLKLFIAHSWLTKDWIDICNIRSQNHKFIFKSLSLAHWSISKETHGIGSPVIIILIHSLFWCCDKFIVSVNCLISFTNIWGAHGSSLLAKFSCGTSIFHSWCIIKLICLVVTFGAWVATERGSSLCSYAFSIALWKISN